METITMRICPSPCAPAMLPDSCEEEPVRDVAPNEEVQLLYVTPEFNVDPLSERYHGSRGSHCPEENKSDAVLRGGGGAGADANAEVETEVGEEAENGMESLQPKRAQRPAGVRRTWMASRAIPPPHTPPPTSPQSSSSDSSLAPATTSPFVRARLCKTPKLMNFNPHSEEGYEPKDVEEEEDEEDDFDDSEKGDTAEVFPHPGASVRPLSKCHTATVPTPSRFRKQNCNENPDEDGVIVVLAPGGRIIRKRLCRRSCRSSSYGEGDRAQNLTCCDSNKPRPFCPQKAWARVWQSLRTRCTESVRRLLLSDWSHEGRGWNSLPFDDAPTDACQCGAAGGAPPILTPPGVRPLRRCPAAHAHQQIPVTKGGKTSYKCSCLANLPPPTRTEATFRATGGSKFPGNVLPCAHHPTPPPVPPSPPPSRPCTSHNSSHVSRWPPTNSATLSPFCSKCSHVSWFSPPPLTCRSQSSVAYSSQAGRADGCKVTPCDCGVQVDPCKHDHISKPAFSKVTFRETNFCQSSGASQDSFKTAADVFGHLLEEEYSRGQSFYPEPPPLKPASLIWIRGNDTKKEALPFADEYNVNEIYTRPLENLFDSDSSGSPDSSRDATATSSFEALGGPSADDLAPGGGDREPRETISARLGDDLSPTPKDSLALLEDLLIGGGGSPGTSSVCSFPECKREETSCMRAKDPSKFPCWNRQRGRPQPQQPQEPCEIPSTPTTSCSSGSSTHSVTSCRTVIRRPRQKVRVTKCGSAPATPSPSSHSPPVAPCARSAPACPASAAAPPPCRAAPRDACTSARMSIPCGGEPRGAESCRSVVLASWLHDDDDGMSDSLDNDESMPPAIWPRVRRLFETLSSTWNARGDRMCRRTCGRAPGDTRAGARRRREVACECGVSGQMLTGEFPVAGHCRECQTSPEEMCPCGLITKNDSYPMTDLPLLDITDMQAGDCSHLPPEIREDVILAQWRPTLPLFIFIVILLSQLVALTIKLWLSPDGSCLFYKSAQRRGFW